MPQFAVRGHHVERAHMVGGVAVGAAEGRAETATQGVTGDSHRGVRPVQRSQPRLGRLRDDLRPYRSGADPGGAADRVDGHVIHPTGRDHDGAVRRTDDLVAGGFHQDRPVLPRRESDGGLDIGRALRHHDHRGRQVVVQVEDGAFVVVSRVAR
jgi:hypothetical protein